MTPRWLRWGWIPTVVFLPLIVGCTGRTADDPMEGPGVQAIGGVVGPALSRGVPAPDFTLPLLDGTGTLQVSELRGQAVVLNFWASWCAPCRAEAPMLNNAARAYAPRGVRFVGVDLQDSLEEARGFVARYGLSYPNVADSRGEASFKYAVSGLPTTFFIGREGQVLRRWTGPLSEKQLAAFIDELLI